MRRTTGGGARWRAPALGVALLAVLSAFTTPASAQLPAPPVVGTRPFQLGGYGSVTFSRPEHPEAVEGLQVSELAAALLAWGQVTPRASYLVELDMAKRNSDTWTGRETSESFAPVRLYVEYTASDLLRVRAGRFLTPVGQWNERHAEPLTWTPTRPLTTYRPFAKSVNGILAAGEGALHGHDVGYALFWAPAWNLHVGVDQTEESAFVSAVGARVAGEVRPGLTLGASAARVRRSHPFDDEGLLVGAARTSLPVGEEEAGGEERDEDAGHRALLGADVRWTASRVELSIEGAWIPEYGDQPYEGGVFTLGALRLHGPLWAVGRAEVYSPVGSTSARDAYAGLALRTGPRLVVKTGWQFSGRPSSKIPDGWFLSFSSLF